MSKQFFDFDREERSEWQRSPVTVAFLARLSDEQATARDECVRYSADNCPVFAAVAAGKSQAFQLSVHIAEAA